MPKYVTIKRETLDGLADAIRDVNGETRTYKPSEMISAVSGIMDSATYILTDAAGNEHYAVYSDSEVVLTATAGDIRKGKIAVTDSGLTTGTMIDEGGTVIPDGYIQPSGRLVITENGTFDVADRASVTVSVKDSPMPIEVLTEDYMTELLDTATPGSIYRYMGPTGIYEYGMLYAVDNTGVISEGGGNVYPLQEKTATENCIVTPDTGYYGLSKVTVNVASGGVGKFNIAYGDAEPTDTAKLWVKASEPTSVNVTSKVVVGEEDLEEWIAALPAKAYGIASAAVGTKIYLFGGSGSNSGYLNTISVFDTETNTITQLSEPLPTSAYNIASAAVGTKIYLFGGRCSITVNSGYLNTISVFDTETNTITQLSEPLPNPAHCIASAAVGTKIYLFGGYDGSGSNNTYLNTINVFDTKSNTITQLGVTLPIPATAIASAVVGTKIYLFGGYDGSDSNRTYLITINVFDTETNTITQLVETLPTSATSIASAVVGTKIYLFGGYSPARGYLSTINVFDTKSNTITQLGATLPAPTESIASAAVGTKVYLFGGYSYTSSGYYYLNTIHKFIAKLPLSENNLLIEASNTTNHFNLLPSLELGVKTVYRGNADGYAEKVPAALYTEGQWKEI